MQPRPPQTSPSQSPFFNAVMAAPMVRVSTLAFRLLCAHYGSSLVFTEELVSAKLMKCKRRYLPQVDFLIDRDGEQVKIPEKFSSVLNQLKQALLQHKNQDSTHHESAATTSEISQILLKWIQQFPFLKECIFSGRVEGLYVGHQQQKSSAAAAAVTVEGEEESEQGEIVFTTLAKLLSRLESSKNKNEDFESALKYHCRHQLVFPKTEAGKPLVGQIGASDPDVAVAGFELLAPFVSAGDINMGCPKAFSVKNGMGAALMANKDGAAKILKALVENFSFLPISYKTRLFENVNDSLDHLKTCFEATGNRLHAFTIHSRNRPQRSETAPLYSDAATLVQMIRTDEELKNLCLIFNGSVAMRPIPDQQQQQNSTDDAAAALLLPERKEIDILLSNSLCGNENILKSVSSYGFNGALLARSSMWKPSVFVNNQNNNNHEKKLLLNTTDDDSGGSTASTEQHSPVIQTLIREFQNLAIAYAACGDQVRLFKYHLTRAVPEYQSAEGVIGRGPDAKKLGAELNQSVFLPIRDGKTLSDFAKALRFTQQESDALNWMMDLVHWRRSLASLLVEESWNPYDPSQGKVAVSSSSSSSQQLPERRERENDVEK